MGASLKKFLVFLFQPLPNVTFGKGFAKYIWHESGGDACVEL